MFPEPYPCCDHCDWECVGELYGHTIRCQRLACVGVRRPLAVPPAIIQAWNALSTGNTGSSGLTQNGGLDGQTAT